MALCSVASFQLGGSGFLARRTGGLWALSRHRLLPRNRAETFKSFEGFGETFPLPLRRSHFSVKHEIGRLLLLSNGSNAACQRVEVFPRWLKSNQSTNQQCKACAKDVKSCLKHTQITAQNKQYFRTTVILLLQYCYNRYSISNHNGESTTIKLLETAVERLIPAGARRSACRVL